MLAVTSSVVQCQACVQMTNLIQSVRFLIMRKDQLAWHRPTLKDLNKMS